MPEPLVWVSDADVAALDLDAGQVRAAIHEAFGLYAGGTIRSEPKSSIGLGPGHAFQSLAAVDSSRGAAVLKWIGIVPPGGAETVNINAHLLLSDVRTGQLRCVMDARRATGLRTAGMSAVAAQYLARPDSVEIGFVGAGVQAASHLTALAEVLPALRSVHVASRTPSTAERFAERSRALGFAAHVATPREVVCRSDVVVTTVPLAPGFEPFLDPGWVRPGSLVLAVDLGRSWIHHGLRDAELTAVDEDAMMVAAKPGNLIPPLGHAQASLARLIGGQHPGRRGRDDRVIFFSSGSAVADLAIAMLIHDRALAEGVGTRLKP